jgi:hypothetical protein
MIKKLLVGSVGAMVATAAAAQEVWQDEQYTHSFDTYSICLIRAIEGRAQARSAPNNAAVDRFFDRCSEAKAANTKLAEARLSKLMPSLSPQQVRARVRAFRRGVVILRMQPIFQQRGLGAQFETFVQRNQEF